MKDISHKEVHNWVNNNMPKGSNKDALRKPVATFCCTVWENLCLLGTIHILYKSLHYRQNNKTERKHSIVFIAAFE